MKIDPQLTLWNGELLLDGSLLRGKIATNVKKNVMMVLGDNETEC